MFSTDSTSLIGTKAPLDSDNISTTYPWTSLWVNYYLLFGISYVNDPEIQKANDFFSHLQIVWRNYFVTGVNQEVEDGICLLFWRLNYV